MQPRRQRSGHWPRARPRPASRAGARYRPRWHRCAGHWPAPHAGHCSTAAPARPPWPGRRGRAARAWALLYAARRRRWADPHHLRGPVRSPARARWRARPAPSPPHERCPPGERGTR
ncbi:hypothetical protein G6F60_014942 [Rhizopus arrhizus]|nr:hypothetical protein G6F60_014942 [Rhizopus arrhizus]